MNKKIRFTANELDIIKRLASIALADGEMFDLVVDEEVKCVELPRPIVDLQMKQLQEKLEKYCGK